MHTNTSFKKKWKGMREEEGKQGAREAEKEKARWVEGEGGRENKLSVTVGVC